MTDHQRQEAVAHLSALVATVLAAVIDNAETAIQSGYSRSEAFEAAVRASLAWHKQNSRTTTNDY